MSVMNPKSFIKLMKLLDLAAVDISQSLYVSPSHVSRWKTGSRELKVSSDYFQQLVQLFLSENQRRGALQLERFLLSDEELVRRERSPEAGEALLAERLEQYLTRCDPELRAARLSEIPAVQVLVGLENRIEALKRFFDHVLALNPKPDLYIKEVLYASWCPQQLDWFSLCHEYALRYMNAGGIIYYFSNLNNLDRSTFYSIWEFTSHKNLYPGYSANMSEESPECAYYLAEGTRSVTFYVPEDQFASYITTVYADPLILSAQEKFLKRKYEQRHHQLFINTIENHNLLLGIVQLYQRKLNPLLFAGRAPSFLLLEPDSLKALAQGRVPEDTLSYCMKFQRIFQEQLMDPAVQKTHFYYKEDILDFAAAPAACDAALTQMAGRPIFLSREVRRELLENLRRCCGDASHSIRIISRENRVVYDALGDAITLWVKRSNWYLIYYPDHTHPTDFRLIMDDLACTLRYDLYYSTLLNVPADPVETAAFLGTAIALLDESKAREDGG